MFDKNTGVLAALQQGMLFARVVCVVVFETCGSAPRFTMQAFALFALFETCVFSICSCVWDFILFSLLLLSAFSCWHFSRLAPNFGKTPAFYLFAVV